MTTENRFNNYDPRKPCLFELGRTVATPGAITTLAEEYGGDKAHLAACELYHRHVRGDWGVVDAEDKASNDHGVKHGERLLSAYDTPKGKRLWVITEWDRSVTTVLLPEEY